MTVESMLVWLGLAAKYAPDIAAWLSNVVSGDNSALERLRAVLPQESESAQFVREHAGLPPRETASDDEAATFQGILAPLDAKNASTESTQSFTRAP